MLRILLLGILLIIVARLFWRLVDGLIEGVSGQPRPRIRRGGTVKRDPVCGTYVFPVSKPTVTVGDTTYYFCSEKCRNEYLAR